MSPPARVIATVQYHFVIAVWRAKETQSGVPMKFWKSSLTISAKPVGVGAVFQPLMPAGEQSGLLTRIAATESASFVLREGMFAGLILAPD
jgi:hypothetical protein